MPNPKLNPVTDRDVILIERVIGVFHEVTGLEIDIVDYPRDKVDAIGYLRTGDTELKLAIEAKAQPTKAFIGYLYQKFTRHLPADRDYWWQNTLILPWQNA